MDIYMRRVASWATEDDVKVALAKILHKPPFQSDDPLLNFDLYLFKKFDSRGKAGILSLPSETVGRLFLRLYGQPGVPVKGSNIIFSVSNKPLNEERLQAIRMTPWRDPQKLAAEKEQRIRQGRPHELASYAFGRFLADGSFSSECTVEGAADLACDLERRQVRFTLRKQSHAPVSSQDFVSMILNMIPLPTLTTASYRPAMIDSIVDSRISDLPILFIRANAFPIFATEINNPIIDRLDSRRSRGLIPDIPMPPGASQLMCTFKNIADKEAFVHACTTRLNLHHTSRQNRISIRDNTLNLTAPNLDFLRQLPFELAFELEKAMLSSVLSFGNVHSLRGALDNLCRTHGDTAAPMFRRFITLLEDEDLPRRRRRRNRNALAPTTLEGRLDHAVDLYLEEQARPRGPLRPALDNPAISYSYHMILTPTSYILEGPVTDQSNSVLRRFGHHDCFLRVSFQDENRSKLRRDLEMSITELLAERYRPVLLKGCTVAGRSYKMLGYSMSGLKEHSLWFVRPFQDEQGRRMDAQTIRDSLGDFSALIYMPARLGARWSQAFSATDPSITLEPQEIETIPDITSSTRKVMTDGCSPISPELARVIWRANQRMKKNPARGKVPSAFQFRLGGAKGMVVQDPTLEGRVVQLRPSQIKFDAPEHRTFDIQSTSRRPKPMFLNRPLIVLLEYLQSSKEHILELQDDSIDEAQSIHQSFTSASKMLQQHGLGSSFHLPSLLRSMSSILNLKTPDQAQEGDEEGLCLSNDLINNCLHCAETYVLRELKYRAHIAVPGSFTLLGVSDEWDCLAEGEIYATVYDEKTGLKQEITGMVAITRSPQIHPGDIQVVEAVRRPELKHLTNVVVFSCRGDRSLSSCLGGGDLDGDDFNLILDPELIPKITSRPGEYISLPIKRTEHACGIEDVVDFIFDYIEADLVGHIAISHLRFSDHEDPSCQSCLRLAELASQAVDFPKTGTPVKFQDLPRPSRMKPDFLAREGADLSDEMYYQSPKLLGELFRRVPLKRWMPAEWTGQESPSQGDVVEQALENGVLHGLELMIEEPTRQLREEMEYLLDDYCKQLLAIAKNHTISKNKDIHISEAELVSGTIMANWSDHHRRREAVGAMNLQMQELVRAVRVEMRATTATAHEESEQEEFTDDGRWWDDEDEDEFFQERRFVPESFKRAWAAWCVAEEMLRDEPASFGPQSFGLIALGRMLDLIKAARLLL